MRTLWFGGVKVLTDMHEVQVPVCPILCLLDKNKQIKQSECIKSNSIRCLLTLGFLSAKRIILMNTKVHKPSYFALWNKPLT